MDKKEWLLNQYRNEPQADEEVLRFIANFVFHENGKTGKGMESVRLYSGAVRYTAQEMNIILYGETQKRQASCCMT